MNDYFGLLLPRKKPDRCRPSAAVRFCAHLGGAAMLTWGERGARVNSIWLDSIAVPLAPHELSSDIGDNYRATIAASPASGMALSEEIAITAGYPRGPRGCLS